GHYFETIIIDKGTEEFSSTKDQILMLNQLRKEHPILYSVQNPGISLERIGEKGEIELELKKELEQLFNSVKAICGQKSDILLNRVDDSLRRLKKNLIAIIRPQSE